MPYRQKTTKQQPARSKRGACALQLSFQWFSIIYSRRVYSYVSGFCVCVCDATRFQLCGQSVRSATVSTEQIMCNMCALCTQPNPTETNKPIYSARRRLMRAAKADDTFCTAVATTASENAEKKENAHNKNPNSMAAKATAPAQQVKTGIAPANNKRITRIFRVHTHASYSKRPFKIQMFAGVAYYTEHRHTYT